MLATLATGEEMPAQIAKIKPRILSWTVFLYFMMASYAVT
jgi:hypothetical protein